MTTREPERPQAASLPPTPLMKGTTPPPSPPMRARQLTIPPPELEELAEHYAKRPAGAFTPEAAIDEQIADLESWARANLAGEARDLTRFWALRGVALVGAIAAAASGALLMPLMAAVAGSLSAVAIAIDAAWPTTADRKARQRAVHDLRELQHTLKLKWDKVRLAYPDPQTPKRIAHALALLDAVQAKREEIGKYLGDPRPGVRRP
jgi:hypothetical protein